MARVDIVMPVKNGATTIKSALASLSYQTFEDIRVLVVDDGSEDATAGIVQAARERDSRIIYLRSRGSGISDALNTGINFADAEFIGRMDADDMSRPDRFDRQIYFLSANQNCSIVGSDPMFFGEKIGQFASPNSPSEIRLAAQLFNPFCHPSTVIRFSALQKAGLYRSEFNGAEDYDLFSRILPFGDAYNITEPLIFLRIHKYQTSMLRKPDVLEKAFQIASRNVALSLRRDNLSRFSVIARMAFVALKLGPRYARVSARSLRNAVVIGWELET